MKLIEIVTCELCPYNRDLMCCHSENTSPYVLSNIEIPELCPLPAPQQWQLSQNTLAGIFYTLAHDMREDFVNGARSCEKHGMENTYRDALLKMIEWAKQNGMCVKSRLQSTLYLMDNPDVEL